MVLYKGYSSFEFQRTKEFAINDVELVKLDLLNHIFTPVGSRVMMPQFGTLIPQMVFEPLDGDTVDTIADELDRVFAFDPRVSVLEFNVDPDFERNAVTAGANLFFVELNLTDNFELNIQFEN